MPRQKAGRPGKVTPALAATAQVATWSQWIQPFVQRRALILVVGIIAIATARIVATYDQLSVTFDEPAHLACGMEYVAHHVYRYESQHPPLARALAAIGPYLDGVRPHGLAKFTPGGD